MALEISVSQGDWGGSLLTDIEAVATSAASTFPVLGDVELLKIVLEPTPGEDDVPITLFAKTPAGDSVVQVSARSNLWAKLAFQFAHEYCHVLADQTTLPNDRFLWLEEAICEAASLYALRAMATTWATTPPFAVWQPYATELERYAAERMSDPDNCLPVGAQFTCWLNERLPLLEANAGLRADNTMVAKELLPLFEADPAAWRAVRYLHSWPRSAGWTLKEFIDAWSNACPPDLRAVLRLLAAIVNPTSV